MMTGSATSTLVHQTPASPPSSDMIAERRQIRNGNDHRVHECEGDVGTKLSEQRRHPCPELN